MAFIRNSTNTARRGNRMNLTPEKIKIARHALLSAGYRDEALNYFMSSIYEWYPIWLEFKEIAMRQKNAGVTRGKTGFMGQMQIIGEVRKKCPARGNKPYEVNNDFAPMAARLFNCLIGYDYFELRASKATAEIKRAA